MFLKKTLPALLASVFSFLLSCGAATVFRACARKEDGTWMHCHDVQIAVTLCAAGLCLLFLFCARMKAPAGRAALCGVGIAGSIVTLLLPGTVMPMCMMKTMRCYALMQPFVRLMCVLIAVCGVIALLQALKTCRASN